MVRMKVRNKVMKKTTFRGRTTKKSQGLHGKDIFIHILVNCSQESSIEYRISYSQQVFSKNYLTYMYLNYTDEKNKS